MCRRRRAGCADPAGAWPIAEPICRIIYIMENKVGVRAAGRCAAGKSHDHRTASSCGAPPMGRDSSAVLEYGVAEPGEIATLMQDKLRFHTDSWDLSVDLKSGRADVVAIDARLRDAYQAGHIPGALSFPHREMNA